MIDVCCAIIVREDGCVFVAQRAANQSLPFKFEFPGGKLEANESPRDCVLREVKEELNLDICIVSEQTPVSYNYPAFSIKLIPFVCRITGGTLVLKEHHSGQWVAARNLLDLDWAAADVPVVKAYLAANL
jgi:8-oxo-dGTP diphosphatase